MEARRAKVDDSKPAAPWAPTVTVAIPVLNEERHIGACLDAVAAQTYPNICEVLVVDGGSTDQTRAVVQSRSDAVLVDNPGRIQARGLNVALAAAKGEIFVRVDGHTVLCRNYVERCVDTLARTGAAMVGGAMTPVAGPGWASQGIAAAMTSRLGAGPARFHRRTGKGRWVDTVYLGAFFTNVARSVGGYAEDMRVNEDAELAWRIRSKGGIWLDPTIRSTYVPRGTLAGLSRQFWHYGRGRAATVRRHPGSLAQRQLVPPALIIGLASPWRRHLLGGYATLIAGRTVIEAWTKGPAATSLGVALPVMHLSWGAGFLTGVLQAPS